MKYIILLLITVSLSTNFSIAQINFQQFFEEGAIRYDFIMVGNYNSNTIIHEQTKKLVEWGGNPNYLIDELDYGFFKFEISDAATMQVIYKSCFSSLFAEWQSTAEAKTKDKSFYHSLFFPNPKIDVVIDLFERNKQNDWQLIHTDTLSKSNYFVLNEDNIEYDIDTILFNGNKSQKIDIVVLAEGYQEDELNKFISDTKRLTDTLFSCKPFVDLKDYFNVFALKVPSLDNGTDIPGDGVYKNTAFNSTFYTFDSPRYLTTSDMKSVYDAVDNIGWDQLYVIVNHSKYGGGGIYNMLNICSSDNIRSPFVFCHEFGHGFAGLGDEYYTSETSYDEIYDVQIEPWEPNLTTLIDFDSKWKKLINKGVAIPTERIEQNKNKIGAYEGGGYQSKGIYSPMISCWMKEKKAGGFCPVCRESIKKVVLQKIKL